MRAVTYQNYGPPEVLSVSEVPLPRPRAGEVRIRVHASEVTKADCELRSFRFPVKWFWLPLRLALGITRPRRQILGGYFSGTVDQVADGATRFRVGDEVFGCSQLRLGTHAEYVCLPEEYTIEAKPRNVSHAEAAAVPLGGLNALHFIRRAALRPGERVLVIGAGGSIGVYAVQLAKVEGAHVTAVDTGHKRKLLLSLGADRFIDYKLEDFAEEDTTYDVILSVVAGTAYRAAMRALRPGGRYLLANPRVSDMLRSLPSRFRKKTVSFALARETREELLELQRLIEAGRLNPITDMTLPLESAREAHVRVEAEERLGPVVIVPIAVDRAAGSC